MQEVLIGLGITLLPAALAIVLPRRKTIGYGQFVYKFLGTFLAQQGNKLVNSERRLTKVVAAIRSTFVDFAFGIYLASKGLDAEETQKLIDKHIKKD